MKLKTVMFATIMVVGLCCVICSGILLYTGESQEQEAENYSATVATTFLELLPTVSAQEPELHPVIAEEVAEETGSVATQEPEPATVAPAIEVDGDQYTCLVSIPSLNVALPVYHTCNDAQLALTPCVFSGSLAKDNLVIAGHNYKAHFGPLTALEPGDTATLIDGLGQLHNYTLTQVETIDGSRGSALEQGTWDLTIFTCVYGNNAKRHVYRFDRI